MRTTISIIALSIAAAAALPAPAAAAGRATTSAAAPSQATPVKYCMKIERATGSRLRETRCLTKAEWELRGVVIDELSRR